MHVTLGSFEQEILEMRRGRADGRPKPHKPLMLLTVLDLLECGRIQGNRIYYDQNLVEWFRDYFEAVARPGDWCQAAPPFFHLRSSAFWHHRPLPGRETNYARRRTSGGGSKRIVENINYAFLDEGLYVALLDAEQRNTARQSVAAAFFSSREQSLLAMVADRHRRASLYESAVLSKQLREVSEDDPAIRSAGFRSAVVRAYDSQCALCGLRITLPEIPSPLDAAHLIPWHVARDDSPNNGMALCRLHHWALDVGLVAPTHSLVWKVSPVLDERRNSERELTRFADLPVLLPASEQFYPDSDSIAWRLKRLVR